MKWRGMMSKKPIAICPKDKTPVPDMVQSTSKENTYHCSTCDTYWHFHYVKYYPISGKRYKWRIVYIRDDFGTKYEVSYVKSKSVEG